MSFAQRVFYQVLSVNVGPTPATGYHWSSGAYGPSGINQVYQLNRITTCTDGYSVPHTNVIQYGALGALDRVIVDPLSSNISFSYGVADLVNEYNLGFAINSGVGILNNIINQSANEKNYFISIAPPGQDQIGYTGSSEVIEITNGYISSYSTEGAVGSVPTASVSVQGYNWASITGSINQFSQAVEPVSGSVYNPALFTTGAGGVGGSGIYFTIPIATTGNVGSTSVIRPAEIQVNINNPLIGLDLNNFNISRYSISVDMNLDNLLRLGNKYPYAKVIRFPVTFRCSVTAYWGNLLSGSINNLFCADSPYTVTVNLFQPCSTNLAAQYILSGVKIDSQELANMSVSDVAGQATVTFDGVIGSSASSQGNLTMSGII